MPESLPLSLYSKGFQEAYSIILCNLVFLSLIWLWNSFFYEHPMEQYSKEFYFRNMGCFHVPKWRVNSCLSRRFFSLVCHINFELYIRKLYTYNYIFIFPLNIWVLICIIYTIHTYDIFRYSINIVFCLLLYGSFNTTSSVILSWAFLDYLW